jgi:2-haloacid dehalogenase
VNANGTLAAGACVFDVYGTLLDVGSAVAREAAAVGARATELQALWRRKQLEYSWLHTLMRRPASFWHLTEAALDHSLEVLGLDAARLRDSLLAAYRQLEAYPEVPAVLRAIRAKGLPTAVLSNGNMSMLEASLEAAAITDLIDKVLSVEACGLFKPSPEVYQVATRAFVLPATSIAFFSANGWDVHGAANFGLQAVWVNRMRSPLELLPGKPVAVVPTLTGAAELLHKV